MKKNILIVFLLALSQISSLYPEPDDQSASEQTEQSDEQPSEDTDNNQDFTITFPNEENETAPAYYPYNPYYYPPPPGQYSPYPYPYPYPPPSYYPSYPDYSQPQDYDYENYNDNYPEDYSNYDYSEPYYYYNYYNYYPQRQHHNRQWGQRGQAMPQNLAPQPQVGNKVPGTQRQIGERSEKAHAPQHTPAPAHAEHAEHAETQQKNK